MIVAEVIMTKNDVNVTSFEYLKLVITHKF